MNGVDGLSNRPTVTESEIGVAFSDILSALNGGPNDFPLILTLFRALTDTQITPDRKIHDIIESIRTALPSLVSVENISTDPTAYTTPLPGIKKEDERSRSRDNSNIRVYKDSSLVGLTTMLCIDLNPQFDMHADMIKRKYGPHEYVVFTLKNRGVDIAIGTKVGTATMICPVGDMNRLVETLSKKEIIAHSKINPQVGYLERNKLTDSEYMAALGEIVESVSHAGPDLKISAIPQLNFQTREHVINLLRGVEYLLTRDRTAFVNLHLATNFSSENGFWNVSGGVIGRGICGKRDPGRVEAEIIAREFFPHDTDEKRFDYRSAYHLRQLLPLTSMIQDGHPVPVDYVPYGDAEISIGKLIDIISGKNSSAVTVSSFLMLAVYLYSEAEVRELLHPDYIKDGKILTSVCFVPVDGKKIVKRSRGGDTQAFQRTLSEKIFDFENPEHLRILLEEGTIYEYEGGTQKSIGTNIFIDRGHPIQPEYVIEVADRNWRYNLLWLARKVFHNPSYEWNSDTIGELQGKL